MQRLDTSPGAAVEANGRRYVVVDDKISLTEIQARDAETGRYETIRVTDLREPVEELESTVAPPLSLLDSEDAEEGRRRAVVIRRLLALDRRTRRDIEAAMEELGVRKTTIYRWINAYALDGRLTSLIPTKRPGGRGKSRLHHRSVELEEIIQCVIRDNYLKPLGVSVSSIVVKIRKICRDRGIKPPSHNTVRARVRAIPEKTRLEKRGQRKKADDTFTLKAGHYEEATHPLSVIQIDHTELAIILVDEKYRLPLKRPWLTVALDVYSRMVVGFYISFDEPGMLGTGLCIARSILPKELWLNRLGIEHEWPCWGFPSKIHVDNAREFRGNTLRLACEQYGIALHFRQVKDPSKGGHIERYMGTINAKHIHLTAGAAKAPNERGEYDSEAEAILTLPELEERLIRFFCAYHNELHSEIKTTPLQRWKDAILGNDERPGMGLFPRPTDEERIRIDFMPAIYRSVQREGVQIDNIFYKSDILRPFVKTTRSAGKKYLFHRDPRDISVLYFWDPDVQRYVAIPYRQGAHPPISVWELREVQRHLEAQGREYVNEDLIFDTYAWLQKHEDEARAKTKAVRRKAERKATLQREAGAREADGIKKTAIVTTVRKFDFIQPLEMEEEL
jgi:putative transposase